MAAFNAFDSAAESLAQRRLNFGGALRLFLSNSKPARSQKFKRDLPEIREGNGYPAGGELVPFIREAETGGVYELVVGNTTFEAKDGEVGPYRACVLYDDGAPNQELIGWWDYGAPISLRDGESFEVDVGGSGGVILRVRAQEAA